MDKPALLGIVRRRWYILVLGLVGSIALGYAASLASPPQYTARALVMLLPSKATVGDDGNPFLELSGLDLPARVVVSSLSSSSVAEQVAEEFPEITYAVTIEESTRGPVIAIDVTGTSEATTLEALPSLILKATATLDRLQSEVDAPPASSVRSMLLTVDRSATEERGGTVRLMIAGVVLGLVATVLSASALDGRIRQRNARRAAQTAAQTAAACPPDPPTTPEPPTSPQAADRPTPPTSAPPSATSAPVSPASATDGADRSGASAGSDASDRSHAGSGSEPQLAGTGTASNGRATAKSGQNARPSKNRRPNRGGAARTNRPS
ncbi:Chain length determinant protein [Nocardioides alpinus]|uniref:Chain length determinant protein n=1 Tax=Nocardioides alpinus TaxID=748909 RepID=A0A1I0VT23_9ACTN|nr:Wzz/FepE/Etk N-terminal domain-containing protein [Nocardioides alpinus]PKH37457.1 hypothetical protein CXG46_18585 [Nocardioides alpinus]SFA79442.1 Chain length determinant protein [Nocardioides alpinus]